MRAKFIPGVSVQLVSNGQALQEYEDQDTIDGENHVTATRYVEAVPDTTFSVHMLVESNFRYRLDDLVLGIRIDGQEITSRVFAARPDLREMREKVDGAVVNIKGVGHVKHLAFGELKTTDEPLNKSEGHKLKNLLSNLGEVTVWMRRGKIVGRNKPRDGHSKFQSGVGESVPEKALKGRSISNRVTLKDGGTCRARGTTAVVYPYGKRSFAKFTFKYRSHRDLQIEGVIPRSPSPQPLEDRDLESMTREEAIEALRQQRAQAAPTARVKRERAATLVIDLSEDEAEAEADEDEDNDNDDQGGVSVIAAGPVKKRQRISNDTGIDMVDLTDD